jgi:hypothetical protein
MGVLPARALSGASGRLRGSYGAPGREGDAEDHREAACAKLHLSTEPDQPHAIILISCFDRRVRRTIPRRDTFQWRPGYFLARDNASEHGYIRDYVARLCGEPDRKML